MNINAPSVVQNNNVQNNNTINHFNISCIEKARLLYPNAKVLGMISLDDIPDAFFDIATIMFHDSLNQIPKYIGDHVVDYYKDKPEEQSMWVTDMARHTCIIKQLRTGEDSDWEYDYKAELFKRIAIDPILKEFVKHIRKYVNQQTSGEKTPIATEKQLMIINKKNSEMIKLMELVNLIENTKYSNDVFKYVVTHFAMPKTNEDRILQTKKKELALKTKSNNKSIELKDKELEEKEKVIEEKEDVIEIMKKENESKNRLIKSCTLQTNIENEQTRRQMKVIKKNEEKDKLIIKKFEEYIKIPDDKKDIKNALYEEIQQLKSFQYSEESSDNDIVFYDSEEDVFIG